MARLYLRREGTSVLIANIGLPAHPSNYGVGRRLHECIDGDFKLMIARADRDFVSRSVRGSIGK